jgi:hypothetical protein
LERELGRREILKDSEGKKEKERGETWKETWRRKGEAAKQQNRSESGVCCF